jgi:hypothetical protein
VTLAFTGPPEELSTIYRTCFGPVLATRAALADDPTGLAALDRELLDFLRSENVGTGDGGGQSRYEFDYLAVTATRRV